MDPAAEGSRWRLSSISITLPALRSASARLRSTIRQGTHSDIGISIWTLRFAEPAREVAFRDSRVRRLRWRLALVGLLGLSFSVDIEDHFHPTPVGRVALTVYRVWMCALSVVCLSLVTFRCAKSKVHPRMVEPLGALTMAILAASGSLSHPASVCDLVGATSDDCNNSPYHQDTFLICFVLSGCTTSWLPLRSTWTAAAVFGISLVPFVQFLRAPNVPNRWGLTCLLASNAFTFAGSRLTEYYERRAFVTLLSEKLLRIQTEFDLETARQSDMSSAVASNVPEEGTSVLNSLPETTNTGKLFENAELKGNLETMQDLESLALQEQVLVQPADLRINTRAVLGEGGASVVVAGSVATMPVAIKIPKEKGTAGLPRDSVRELRVLRKLRHPNLMGFHGVSFLPNENLMILVVELVPGVSLSTFMKRPLADTHRLHVLEDICNALIYLHSRSPSIVHTDLKPANVQVRAKSLDDALPQAVLLDFGLARICTRTAKTTGGTSRWMAPEAAQSPTSHPSQDAFSFGRVVFFAVTGQVPSFKPGMAVVDVADAVVIEWGELRTDFEQRLQRLADRCMQVDPQMRPAMRAVAQELRDIHIDVDPVFAEYIKHEEHEGGFADAIKAVLELQHKERVVARLRKFAGLPKSPQVLGLPETHRKADAKPTQTLRL